MKCPLLFHDLRNTNESGHEKLEALRLSSARKAGRGDSQRRRLDGLSPVIFLDLGVLTFKVLGLRV